MLADSLNPTPTNSGISDSKLSSKLPKRNSRLLLLALGLSCVESAALTYVLSVAAVSGSGPEGLILIVAIPVLWVLLFAVLFFIHWVLHRFMGSLPFLLIAGLIAVAIGTSVVFKYNRIETEKRADKVSGEIELQKFAKQREDEKNCIGTVRDVLVNVPITKIDIEQQQITIENTNSPHGGEQTEQLCTNPSLLDAKGEPVPLSNFKVGDRINMYVSSGLTTLKMELSTGSCSQLGDRSKYSGYIGPCVP